MIACLQASQSFQIRYNLPVLTCLKRCPSTCFKSREETGGKMTSTLRCSLPQASHLIQ